MPFSTIPTYMTIPCSQSSITVPAGIGTTVIKPGPGVLSYVLVTSAGAGTGSILFYDNAYVAQGTVIGATPAAATTVGQAFTFNSPAANGIICSNPTNGPAMTIFFI